MRVLLGLLLLGSYAAATLVRSVVDVRLHAAVHHTCSSCVPVSLPTGNTTHEPQLKTGVQGKLVWTQNEEYAVYTTAGISRTKPGGKLSYSMATWLNQPVYAEAYNAQGKQNWQFVSSNDMAIFDTAQARHVDMAPVGVVDVAVAEMVPASNEPNSFPACNLYGFASSSVSDSPTWTYMIQQCETDLLAYGVATSVAISDDGSTVGFAVFTNTSSVQRASAGQKQGPSFTTRYSAEAVYSTPTSQLHVLNAQTGKLMFIYDLGPSVTAGTQSVSLSRDGSYIAFTTAPTVYVLTNTGTLRTPAITLPYTAPVQICPMGTFLTFGSQSAEIWVWNPSNNSYVQRYNFAVPNWYFWTSVTSWNGGGSAPSGNGCMAAFGFSNPNVNQLRVEVYSMLHGTHYLSWTGPLNVQGQTMPTLSFHMNYLGVASWGDANGGVPQIMLFDVTAPSKANVPIFNYTTPGSMFAIEIEVLNAPLPPPPSATDRLSAVALSDSAITTGTPAPNAKPTADVVNLIASGKHTHASEFGNGGDAFAFQITVPT